LSSTTDRRRERGQVLAIFSFGLVGILAIAALVFDVGQNLFERRKQQDAADSAALAGARFMTVPACRTAPSTTNCAQAVAAASEIAQQHGYTPSQITINIPPDSASQFYGEPGHLQVTLSSDRGSYFAGVLGLANFRIATQAVAANIDQYPLPFSLLSLNSGGGSGCKAGHITGNGTVDIEGDVMVSATCTNPGALSFDGSNVVVNISGQCGTTGAIGVGPSDSVSCGTTAEGLPPVDDPLAGLDGPTIGSAAVPNPPADMVVTGDHTATNKPPNGCPGSTTSPPSEANPVGCDVQFNRPKTVRLYPGVYWGGLKLRETSEDLIVYMEPGIYYMAGGGFQVSGAVNLYTVDPGGTTYGSSTDAGVTIFNTDHPDCSTGGGPCIAAIDFQNTTGGTIQMRGYRDAVYKPLLFFQDRDASSQPALKLAGNTLMSLSGVIYLPEANFDYAGNSAGEVLGAQVICDTFKISGNGGLTITYDPDEAVQQSGTGLVQ
jgi:hypothetical protein